jgi:hypothetical protein
MEHDKNKPKPGSTSMQAPRQTARGRKPAGDAAFDLWLQRGLHRLYDEVAREPVPEELLRLIERDKQG